MHSSAHTHYYDCTYTNHAVISLCILATLSHDCDIKHTCFKIGSDIIKPYFQPVRGMISDLTLLGTCARGAVVILCACLSSIKLHVAATYLHGSYVENKVTLGFLWHFQVKSKDEDSTKKYTTKICKDNYIHYTSLRLLFFIIMRLLMSKSILLDVDFHIYGG